MEKTLHLKLKPISSDIARLRCFTDNPNEFTTRDLNLAEVEHLINDTEAGYNTALPRDLEQTGRQLYAWLDGADRFLDSAIQSCLPAKVVALAIDTQGRLSHLPWEVMHNGREFFARQQYPAVVPLRWHDRPSRTCEISNRPPQVLFMATSPRDVEPVLDFENEEGLILDATSRFPVNLTVEESGELEELNYLINSYGSGWFDIVHLSGHADLTDAGGRFLTESQTGSSQPASATDIADALPHKPKMVFLSGCRTAEGSSYRAVPSLCEELLAKDVPAVLGWGRPVLDREASQAAASLYGELSKGLITALSETRRQMAADGARDWHLLRLYVAGQTPGPLVTPLQTEERLPALPVSLATRFLDAHHRIKVPTRQNFVGRRRAIQRCLRQLREADKLGVVLYGMGGLGKSSLAARLCDRLKDTHHVIVLVGAVDEPALVNAIAEELEKLNKDQRKALLSSDDELKYRLRPILSQIKKSLLIVLDDFERNFEHAEQDPVLRDGLSMFTPEIKEIMSALTFAFQKSAAKHRIIITSRYWPENTHESRLFHVEQLARLSKPDVGKKVNRLRQAHGLGSKDVANLEAHAQKVADGNPRLLEWLYKILALGDVDHPAILKKMESKAVEFRESILAETLLRQQRPELRDMLGRLMVYHIAVPIKAVQAVCKDIAGLDEHLDRASALGLVESIPSEEVLYRVPRILAPLLNSGQPTQVQDRIQTACSTLHDIWWQNADGTTEEHALEIHRLALLAEQPEIALQISNLLAATWDKQGRYREGERLCCQTMALAEKVLDDDHPDMATGIAWYGSVLQAIGNYQAACPYLERSVDINKKVGEEHPDYASSLNNLAGLYESQGRYEEAEPLYQQAMAIAKKVLGQEHSAYATSLNNLAGLYESQGRYEEAEPLYQQALAIRKKVLGQEHPDYASSLNNLAHLYKSQGRYEEAEPLYQQAMAIRKKVLGQEHPAYATSLNNLAILKYHEAKYKDALDLMESALTVFLKTLGPDHPYTKGCVQGLEVIEEAFKNQESSASHE